MVGSRVLSAIICASVSFWSRPVYALELGSNMTPGRWGIVVTWSIGAIAASYILGSLLTRAGRRALSPPLPVPNLEELVPFIRIEEDLMTVTCEPTKARPADRNAGKANSRFIVLEAEGLNFASIHPDDLESFRKAKIPWQSRLAECKVAAHVIFDHKLISVSVAGSSNNEFLDEVNKTWRSKFQNAFSNRNYIVLIDEGEGDLNEALTSTRNILQEIKPRVLMHFDAKQVDVEAFDSGVKAPDSKLWQFLYEEINSDIPVRSLLNMYDIPRSIQGAEMEFNEQTGTHVIYDGIRTRYIKYVVLTKAEKESIYTDMWTMRKLLSIPHEISVCLCLRPRGSSFSSRKLKAQKSNQEFKSDGISNAQEENYKDLTEKFREGEEGITETEVIIKCQGDSELDAAKAAEAVIEVWTQSESFRAGVAALSVQNEFLRRLPAGGVPIRELSLSRSSVADWTPFEGTPRGTEKCWWGPHPLRLVRTTGGSAYALGIHEHEREEALGNTSFIGKPGSGKTVLASWMITGALTHFPKMKVLCFDNMDGLSVSTRAFGGEIVRPGQERFAPLQLDDTLSNRSFLQEMLQEMSGCTTRPDQLEIEQGLDMMMTMPKSERTLDKFLKDCVYTNSDVGQGLSAWVGQGAHAGWMDADECSLDFNKSRWITFDMTRLLTNPTVCSIYMAYVMHRLQNDFWLGAPQPHIIFVDEAPTMFAMSPLLAKTFELIARNIRRKMGAIWFAFQDAEGMGASGPVITSSSSTLVFWRNPSLDKKLYKETFNLSDSDINFILDKDESSRHLRRSALFIQKRESGQVSTPLDLGLEGLGEYLGLFRAGEDAAHLAEECLIEYGADQWVRPYLARLKQLQQSA